PGSEQCRACRTARRGFDASGLVPSSLPRFDPDGPSPGRRIVRSRDYTGLTPALRRGVSQRAAFPPARAATRAGRRSPGAPGVQRRKGTIMATSTPMMGETLLGAIKGHAGIAVGVGITLILGGVLAICAPKVAGVSVMTMIGVMLVIGGVA